MSVLSGREQRQGSTDEFSGSRLLSSMNTPKSENKWGLLQHHKILVGCSPHRVIGGSETSFLRGAIAEAAQHDERLSWRNAKKWPSHSLPEERWQQAGLM
jgi:hypothetical protein